MTAPTPCQRCSRPMGPQPCRITVRRADHPAELPRLICDDCSHAFTEWWYAVQQVMSL